MIPVYTPLLEGNEKKYVMQALHAGEVSSSGKFVRKFEEAFADWIGVKHAVAVSSGTTALETALHAVGVSSGDEVVLPSFTIISCAVAVLRVGATPVLVDVARDSWCIDPAQVEAAITEKTAAVMPVHMMGNPADLNALKEHVWLDLKRRDIQFVEDACQAHGAEYVMWSEGSDETVSYKCGRVGAAGCFSFYANKLITTGEGGMVTTDDDEIASRACAYRNLYFGANNCDRFRHEDLGFNFRMGNLQAAVGLAQLEQADERLERKKELWDDYHYRLEGIDWLKGIDWPAYTEGAVPWMAAVTTPLPAKEVIAALGELGIEARPLFLGLHEQPCLRKHGVRYKPWEKQSITRPDDCLVECPNTEFLSQHALYLPSGLDLTTDQIDYICSSLEEILHAMPTLQT